MGKGGKTRWPLPIIVVSRIVEREAVSLQPSLLVQGDMGMRKPYSLLAMYAERGRHATMIGSEG